MTLLDANRPLGLLRNVRANLATLVFVLTLVTLASTPAAYAQGTYGAMPDPISQRELDRYADRMQLTDAQRQGLDQVHASYRETFRELREGEIEQFMKDTTSRGMQLMTNPDLMKKTLVRYQRLNGTIESLDRSLFDEVVPLLSQEQLLLLERVRDARKRVRNQAASTWVLRQMNPAAGVDFSTMYDEMTIPPDVLATADPLMQDYETSLTQNTTRLHQYVVGIPTELIEQLEDMGYTAESISDPSTRGQLFQDFRTIWTELEAELVKKSFQVSDLNRNTLIQFRTVLPDDVVDELWRGYLKTGYQSANPMSGSVDQYFAAALTLDGLEPSQRDMIALEREQLKGSVDRLTRQMVDAIDGDRKNVRMMDRWGRSDENEYRQRLGKLREERAELRERAIENLELILGQAAMQQVKAQLRSGSAEQTASTETGGADRRGPRSWRSTSGSKGVAARWLSPPISQEELNRLSERLNLDEPDKELVRDLYDDYRADYQMLMDGELAPANEVQKQLWAMDLDEDNDVTPPSRSDLDAAFALRSDAVSRLAETDQQFLNNVSLMFVDEGSPLLQRLVNDRTRARCISMRTGHLDFIPTWIIGMEDTDEPTIDLVEVVYSSDLTKDEITSLDNVLIDYEDLATAAFLRAHEEGLAFEATVGGLMVEAAQSDDRRERWRTFRNVDADPLRSAQSVLMQLNRRTLDEILAELTPSSASRVQGQYNRRGFGVIYQDSNSASDLLENALSLPDLTADQRKKIVDISIEYRSEYEQLSGDLVAMAIAATDPDQAGDDRGWQERMETERSREQLEFERNELSDRARNQLRMSLNDSQISQLGGIQPAQAQ